MFNFEFNVRLLSPDLIFSCLFFPLAGCWYPFIALDEVRLLMRPVSAFFFNVMSASVYQQSSK